MKTIDATGKPCPIPVILTKKALEENPEEGVATIVDNEVARDNLKKLAHSLGVEAEAQGAEPAITVTIQALGTSEKDADQIKKDSDQAVFEACPTGVPSGDDYVVFFGKNFVGEGDMALGTNLVRMFFYSLTESDKLPTAILFMNSGVKLPTLDDQVVENLKVLEGKGVEILVCGACLDFYGLKDELKVGSVSNMYEISQRIINASKEVVM